jgi:DNA-binding beta-propeller fold protein YncE
MSRSSIVALALALAYLSLAGVAFANHHPPCEEPQQQDPNVALPGDFFYPEGIDHTSAGIFYVSSLPTGTIATFQAGDSTATVFSQGVLSLAVGVYVDEAINTLWVCGNRDVEVSPGIIDTQTGLQGFDLTTAAPVAFHIFNGGGFCNDIAQDKRGNLYITDSAGWRVMRVAADDRLTDSASETWLADPRFSLEPGEGTGLSVNGIAYSERGNNLYVVNITRGELYEIKVKGNGQPGKVTTIELNRPINGPDGVEVIDKNTLLVVENFTGTLSFIELQGKHGTINEYTNALGDSPTTTTEYNDQYWTVVGQLDRLFLGNPNPPNLPFQIVTVPAP